VNTVLQIGERNQLPSYPEEQLAALDAVELLELIVADEDRVPRNVIDAAASRGDAMVAALTGLLDSPWDKREDGEWWLLLHAAMILGLIAQENAGLLLVRWMRRMSEEGDENLQDWLAGYWPVLFANKPATVLAALRDLCEDETLYWYIRANALEPLIAGSKQMGPTALEDALAWAARLAADETRDWEMRLYCGSILIDFPRQAYRPLLDDLASRQTGLGRVFDKDEVIRTYAVGKDDPRWTQYQRDPQDFYQPDAINKRQERWAKEHHEAETVYAKPDYESIFSDDGEPYVRETPKIGRNDPCHCGSEKKYKKCCLDSDEAQQ
jgi:hypothetical protein